MSANLPPIFIESSGLCGMVEYTLESDRETLERLKALEEKLDKLLARGKVQPI